MNRTVVALGKIGPALAAQLAGKCEEIVELISTEPLESSNYLVIKLTGVIQLRALAAA